MIKYLKLNHFRIFKQLELSFNNQTVIFFGNNALGKTSILEAIYLCGLTKSHRTTDESEAISFQEEFSKITVVNENKYEVILSKNGKKVLINRVEYRKLSDYVGNLNVIFFSPQDLSLIKGTPNLRRTFLDLEIGQMSKNYLHLLSNYKQVLKSRNELLKNHDNRFDSNLFIVITEQLVELGSKIIEMRKKFFDQINQYLQNFKLNEFEKINIEYLPSCDLKDYLQIMKNKEKYDILTKVTNYGPHRDDFVFYLNDKLAKNFCSQGQIRSIILSLKLALVVMIKKTLNKTPILLLDDVFSELDMNRQNNLLKQTNEICQTFITATSIDLINKDLTNKSQLFEITKNCVKEVIL